MAMDMVIREGVYYRTASGEKVSMRSSNLPNGRYVWTDGSGRLWSDDGERAFGDVPEDNIVSAWNQTNEGPVRTVTRREIVLGEYDCVRVNGTNSSAREVSIIIQGWMSPDELRSAAMILSQLAEALDDSADKEKE